jgi:hypothetical protein
MLYPRRFIAMAIILLATLVSVGVVQGLWTDRWVSHNASQEELATEMEKMPLNVGAWEGKAFLDNPDYHPRDEANNYALRRYVSHVDGTVATIMLTRGRPGPLVIKHLPTECYPSSGYELVGQPKRFLSTRSHDEDPGGKDIDEFWVATFKKTNELVPMSVRIYWSWSGSGQWQVPDRPRLTFARFPVLYKLYVVRTLINEDEELEGAPVHDLIKELTREMRKSFFTAAPQL